MKYEIAKMPGEIVDAAVAQVLGLNWKCSYEVLHGVVEQRVTQVCHPKDDGPYGRIMRRFSPSTSWADAGPILEEHWSHCVEALEDWLGLDWMVKIDSTQHSFLRTMMQAFVMWKLGLEREVELHE